MAEIGEEEERCSSPDAGVADRKPDANGAERRHEGSRDGDTGDGRRIAHADQGVGADSATGEGDAEVQRVGARASADLSRDRLKDVQRHPRKPLSNDERDEDGR